MVSTYWMRVHHCDVRARLMADRHYSRQTPGAREFVGNGHKIVLLQLLEGCPVAVWASHRPAPGKAVRADGRDVWACTLFRVEERTVPASVLIREAVAITKHLWGAVRPADGFYTTINPGKVRPTMVHGVQQWGYSWRRAGWFESGRTKARNLMVFLLSPEQLDQVDPVCPMVEAEQLRLL
jgi:hypothetical protein